MPTIQEIQEQFRAPSDPAPQGDIPAWDDLADYMPGAVTTFMSTRKPSRDMDEWASQFYKRVADETDATRKQAGIDAMKEYQDGMKAQGHRPYEFILRDKRAKHETEFFNKGGKDLAETMSQGVDHAFSKLPKENQDLIDGRSDAQELTKRIYNTQMMSQWYGKPYEQVADGYDTFAKHFASNTLKMVGKYDDSSIFTASTKMVQDHAKAKEQKDMARQSVIDAATDSVFGAESNVDAVKRINPAMFPETMDKGEVRRTVMQYRKNIQKRIAPHLNNAKLLTELMAERGGADVKKDPTVKDDTEAKTMLPDKLVLSEKKQDEILSRVSRMTKEEQNNFVYTVSKMVETSGGDVDGFWRSMMSSMNSSLVNIGDQIGETVDRAVSDPSEAFRQGMTVTGIPQIVGWKGKSRRDATPKKAQYYDLKEKMRNYKAIAAKVEADELDDYLVDGAEKALYSIAATVPYMAIAATPHVGLPAIAASFHTEVYHELNTAHPDMNEGDKEAMALVLAPILGGIERISGRGVLKGFPTLDKWARNMGVQDAVTLGTMRAIGGGLAETGQELAQQGLTSWTQEALSKVNEDIPGVDAERWQAANDFTNPDIWSVTMTLGILGGGGRTALERMGVAKAQELFNNEDAMRLVGATAEEAGSVMSEKDAFVQQKMLESILSKPKAEREAAVKDAKQDGAERRLEDKYIEEHGSEGDKAFHEARRTEEAYVREHEATIETTEDGRYEVRYPDSSNKPIDSFETQEEADTQLEAYGRDLSNQFMQELVDSRSNVEAMKAQKKVLKDAHGAEGSTHKFESPIEFAEQSKANMDQMIERVSREIGRVATVEDIKQFRIMGDNMIRKRARGYIYRLAKNANLSTVVEEGAEGFLKDLTMRGKDSVMDKQWVKAQIITYNGLADTKVTKATTIEEMTDQDMVEAFSDMAMANFWNNRNDEKMPQGLRGVMDSLRRFFLAVMDIATDLKAIRGTGKLDSDFETLLDQSVGINMDEQVERMTEKAQQEILDEVEGKGGTGETFSGESDFSIAMVDTATKTKMVEMGEDGYIKSINDSGKWHPSEAYGTTANKLGSFNKIEDYPRLLEVKDGVEYRSDNHVNQYAKKTGNEWERKENGDLIYYTDEEVKAKGLKKYRRDMAAFVDGNAVGTAGDEWGAVLVLVANEYKGQKIGPTLASHYRAENPWKDSGGFTDLGENQARKVYRHFTGKGKIEPLNKKVILKHAPIKPEELDIGRVDTYETLQEWFTGITWEYQGERFNHRQVTQKQIDYYGSVESYAKNSTAEAMIERESRGEELIKPDAGQQTFSIAPDGSYTKGGWWHHATDNELKGGKLKRFAGGDSSDMGGIFLVDDSDEGKAYSAGYGNKMYRVRVNLDSDEVFNLGNPEHLARVEPIELDDAVGRDFVRNAASSEREGTLDWTAIEPELLEAAGFKAAILYERPAGMYGKSAVRSLSVFDEDSLSGLEQVPADELQEIRKKQINNPDSSFSIAPTDAAYLAAVESGDVATQQSMVDAAARKAVPLKVTKYKDREVFELPQKNGIEDGFGSYKKTHAQIDFLKTSTRNKGVGSAAVLSIEAGARSRGLALIKGDVLQGSEGFWKKMGYTLKERKGKRATMHKDLTTSDPITRDKSGQVIPLSQRFDSTDDRISHSIAPTGDPVVERIHDLMRNPETRLAVYQRMTDKLERVRMAVYNMAVIGYHRDDATEATKDMDTRQIIAANLAQLDAIISVLPPAIRHKIGGARAMSKFKTIRGAENFLINRLEMADQHLDKYLNELYVAKFDDLAETGAAKKGKNDKLHKARMDAEADKELKAIMQVRNMTDAEYDDAVVDSQTKMLGIEENKHIEEDDRLRMVAEEEANAARLTTYGRLESRSAEDAHTAYTQLEHLVTTGKSLYAQTKADQKEANDIRRMQTINAVTGGKGKKFQHEQVAQSEEEKLNTIKGFMAKNKSVEGLLEYLSRFDKGSEAFSGFLFEEFAKPIHEATHGELRSIAARRVDFERMIAAVYGIDTKLGWAGKVQERLAKLAKTTPTTNIMLEEHARRRVLDIPRAELEDVVAGLHDTVHAGHSWVRLTPREIAKLKVMLEEDNTKERGAKKQKFKFAIESKGRISEQTHSQDTAMMLTMMYAQPDLRPAMEAHGYTADAMKQFEKFLTHEAKLIRTWLFRKYQEIHPYVNAEFVRMFGTHMPNSKKYAPARFSHGGKQIKDMIDAGHGKQSTTPGFAMERIRHKAAPRFDAGATEIYHSHIDNMEHFVHWSETIQNLRTTFMDRDVMEAITTHHGKEVYSELIHRIDVLADGGNISASTFKVVDHLRKTFTVAKLAYKWTITLKQLTSDPAYLFDTPVLDFYKHRAAFMLHPLKSFKKMWNLPFVQHRFKDGYDRDVKLILAKGKRKGKMHRLAEWGMIAGSVGDILPVIVGGYSSYMYNYEKAKKAGMTDKQAEARAELMFEMATERTQQAGHNKDQSHYALGGSFPRLFTMFQTSPRQYENQVVNSYSGYAGGRSVLEILKEGGKGSKKGSTVRLAKSVLIAHVVLPSLFHFASVFGRNAFKPDEDDEEYLTATWFTMMAMGGWSGYGMLGIALGEVASGYEYTLPVLESATEVSRGKNKLVNAASAYLDDGETISTEDVIEVSDKFATAVSLSVGKGTMLYDIGKNAAASVGFTKDDVAYLAMTEEERGLHDLGKIKGDLYKAHKLPEKDDDTDAYYEAQEARYDLLAEQYQTYKDAHPDMWEKLRDELKEKGKLPEAVEDLMN